MELRAEKISKDFFRYSAKNGYFIAVQETDLHLAAGTLTAVTGRSGSGKSMTLKCIAGLERPDRGQILLNGRTLYDSEKAKEFAQRAGIGYVELGTMPYEFFQQKVEGIPRLGPGTGAVTAYVADSRQWLLAGVVVGGMIVCLPLLLHLTVVAPALNLLWILLFGLGGFLFGGIASIPLLRHYREHIFRA